MAFRHWIDVVSVVLRSGDYPIKNSRFVGVAVILSGLSHIAGLIHFGQSVMKNLSESQR